MHNTKATSNEWVSNESTSLPIVRYSMNNTSKFFPPKHPQHRWLVLAMIKATSNEQ